MIIGLAGYTKCGKDTVAGYLVSKYGFAKRGFADAMKQHLRILNPIVGVDNGNPVTYSEAYDRHGDGCREVYPEVRRLEQVYGTDVGRAHWGEDCWLEKARQAMVFNPSADNVFKDVRFENEVEFVANQFGHLVWIERECCKPINSHASERYDVRQWCREVIDNNGTLEELYAQVDALVAELRLFDEQLGEGIVDMMSTMLDAADKRIGEGTQLGPQEKEDGVCAGASASSDSVSN